MALEFTKNIALGYKAPEFLLLEPFTGKYRSYVDLRSNVATVVMFICNHCPYVKHVNEGLLALARDYQTKGIAFIAINSNDADKYPEDSPEKMIEAVKELNYPFTYLFDETQQSAKDYYAVCTPDFSIFDSNDACVYRGQLDDSRPGNNIPVTAQDLRIALDELLSGNVLTKPQVPSAGCSIKWKY